MFPTERRRGFSLIEIIVVIAVIALLVGLLLPAVQYSREAARRIRCANNLKNIGVAIHNHADAHNAFPSGIGAYPSESSLLFQILPYMEQVALYNSINLTDGVQSNNNITAMRQTPGSYLCPSDSSRDTAESTYASNYAGNTGQSATAGEGVFIGRPLAARDITDGLSQTVGVAEWIVGPGLGEVPSRLGSKYRLIRSYTNSPTDVAAFVLTCETLSDADITVNFVYPSKGQFWLEGGLGTSLYNHMMTPNRPSCSALLSLDATTAGSYHSGAAHVLTMDGGVHFVKESIARSVWSAVGTRATGEVDARID